MEQGESTGVPVCLECGRAVPMNDMHMFFVSEDNLLDGPEVRGGVTHKACAEAFAAKLTAALPETPVADEDLACPQCGNRVPPGLQAEGRDGVWWQLGGCGQCGLSMKRQPEAEDNRWRRDEKRQPR